MLKRWLSVFAVLTLAYSSAPAQEARVDIGHLICGLGEGAEVESSGDALTGEPRKILLRSDDTSAAADRSNKRHDRLTHPGRRGGANQSGQEIRRGCQRPLIARKLLSGPA